MSHSTYHTTSYQIRCTSLILPHHATLHRPSTCMPHCINVKYGSMCTNLAVLRTWHSNADYPQRTILHQPSTHHAMLHQPSMHRAILHQTHHHPVMPSISLIPMMPAMPVASLPDQQQSLPADACCNSSLQAYLMSYPGNHTTCLVGDRTAYHGTLVFMQATCTRTRQVATASSCVAPWYGAGARCG